MDPHGTPSGLGAHVEQTEARNAPGLGTLLNARNRLHNGTCRPVVTRFLTARLIVNVLRAILADFSLTTVRAARTSNTIGVNRRSGTHR
jgi:hypothetical protein